MYDGDRVYEEEYYQLFERLTSIYDYRIQYMLLVNRFNTLAIRYNRLVDENIQLKIDNQILLNQCVLTEKNLAGELPTRDVSCNTVHEIMDVSGNTMDAVTWESVDVSGNTMDAVYAEIPRSDAVTWDTSCNPMDAVYAEIPRSDAVTWDTSCNPMDAVYAEIPRSEAWVSKVDMVDTSCNPMELPIQVESLTVLQENVEKYMIYFDEDSNPMIPPQPSPSPSPQPSPPPPPVRPFVAQQKMRKSHFAKMKFM
jgi:hypothetical protein